MATGWSYRRDRWGEDWHIVPVGELGINGRTLCGQPRQGTPLSEGHAATEPPPPEQVCRACASRAAEQGMAVPGR